jgi:hypothetical protein
VRKQQKIINLFEDRLIHSVKQVVSIGDEEDLNQLWEYIISIHSSDSCETYAFFIRLYELSSQFLESNPGIFFEIILEQSDENYYFTVWNKTFINFARKHWKKRRLDYRFKNKRITIRLSKSFLEDKKAEKLAEDNSRIDNFLATIQRSETIQPIPPYTFMDSDDVIELNDIAKDMNEYLYMAQQIGFTPEALIKIRTYFSRISMILNYYEEIEQIAIVMTEFSMMIHYYKEAFAQLTTDQIRLIEGFSGNFERWLKILFMEGGAELNFMNRSLRADMEMIRLMIEPPVAVTKEELDAIFDF